jgi:type II secretory pathway component GspD/PulD (secretin)
MLSVSANAQPQTSDISISGSKRIVSLDIKNMNINDVLKIISDTSGWSIIASSEVNVSINIWLKDITVEEALRKILEVNGLVYEREGNTVIVMKEDTYVQKYGLIRKVFPLGYAEASDLEKVVTGMLTKIGKAISDVRTNSVVIIDTAENLKRIEEALAPLTGRLETYVYQLNYADPEKIMANLAKNIPDVKAESKGRIDLEQIKVDKRTRTVTITAPPEKIATIKALLSAWDARTKQVFIEAKIMLVSTSILTKLGIDWTYTDFMEKQSAKLQGTFPADIASGTSNLSFELGNLATNKYHAAIQALETDSNTDLLSNPKILVIDGQMAEFSVGSDQPYKVVTIEGQTGLRIEDVKFARVGVILAVVPLINDEGYITMQIHPEVSSLSELRENIPVIEKREAKSVVMVKDGQTIVIGGLIDREKVKTITGIPLLSRIPLLGSLFGSTRYNSTKRELVIFMTPKIVTDEYARRGTGLPETDGGVMPFEQ